MTEEELEKEQRLDFEARRDLALLYLARALNEGDAEIFDITVEKNKEGEDVAWIDFKDGEVERVNIHGDTIITAIREILSCVEQSADFILILIVRSNSPFSLFGNLPKQACIEARNHRINAFNQTGAL